MDLDYIGLTIRKLYDIIVQNWLMILLTVIILWLAMLALNRPEPENKTIIHHGK